MHIAVNPSMYKTPRTRSDGDSKPLVPKHRTSLITRPVVNGTNLPSCRPLFFEACDAIVQADQILTHDERERLWGIALVPMLALMEGTFSIAFMLCKVLNRVGRLQIVDAEDRNVRRQGEATTPPGKDAVPQTNWIPRTPAAYMLTRHQYQVLCCFPPPCKIVTFAGDESSTKIWDWDMGEFERMLEEHAF